MKIINAKYEIVTQIDREEILKRIEYCGRTCYKSENKITSTSAENFVKTLIKNGHEAMLEHYSITVKFIIDRGVSHEIVRHRLASYAQESTRYCNYNKTGEITVIKPCFLDEHSTNFKIWKAACEQAERAYFDLLNKGCTPQEARNVLPNSLKTELIMTANLREWRHFFKLRAIGITGKPHPQMTEVTLPLLRELTEVLPEVFDDLEGKIW